MTTEYRILEKWEKCAEGDEFQSYEGSGWWPSRNWRDASGIQETGPGYRYRRPLPARRPYFPKWLRPDAPSCPVHVLWAESPAGIATVAQVAAEAKPEALEPKPEPGTGYRLLGDDEIVQIGDTWYNPGSWQGDWNRATGSVGKKATHMGFTYRRKLETPKLPEYRPYANAAEAAAGLQGKLIVEPGHAQNPGCYYPVNMVAPNAVRIESCFWAFDSLLKYWKFIDGTPCGVLVTQEKGTK